MPPSTTLARRRDERADQRVERLSGLSLKRLVEPDEAVTGHVGETQIIPTELLSIAGLGIELTAEQLTRLAREELASIAMVGVRFECALMAGFSLDILRRDLCDPRVTYILHEMGEETRHSRLFIRLIEQLAPTADNPFDRFDWLVRRVVRRVIAHPALFCVLVLTGEEIPDLLQKLVGEHPDTDPFVRAVSRYHRQEEARHLSFGRLLLPELWEAAPRAERLFIRYGAPLLVTSLFDTMVNPGVYASVGLPAWSTWRAVKATPVRQALRHEALRPLVAAMLDAKALTVGRIPRAWRRAAGIDRQGVAIGAPLVDATPAGTEGRAPR